MKPLALFRLYVQFSLFLKLIAPTHGETLLESHFHLNEWKLYTHVGTYIYIYTTHWERNFSLVMLSQSKELETIYTAKWFDISSTLEFLGCEYVWKK